MRQMTTCSSAGGRIVQDTKTMIPKNGQNILTITVVTGRVTNGDVLTDEKEHSFLKKLVLPMIDRLKSTGCYASLRGSLHYLFPPPFVLY